MEAIDETMIKRNLEYIKLEWADIHHSRQQEWSALVVIAGIFYAIARVDLPPPQSLEAKIFLGLLGVLSAFLGAWICWQHHEILQQKISLIVKLERQIGIQYPVRCVWFPVQVLLFWLFGGICSAFVGITLSYAVQARGYLDLQLKMYGVGIATFLLFLVFAVLRRWKALRSVTYGYRHPFYAEMEDLERCLASLGDVPLKLIVGGTLDRPGIREVPWESPQWTWQLDSKSVTKPVLLNRRDVFQSSLAAAFSRQDWHQHKSTFEVYVSDDQMAVEYEEQGTEKKLRVDRGVLIIPPGIPHKASLSGSTFVFQATLAGRGLGQDKVKAL